MAVLGGVLTRQRSAGPAPSSCTRRLIIVSNHLPVRVKRGGQGWEFEWDEDALVAQAKVRTTEWPCDGLGSTGPVAGGNSTGPAA